MCKNRRCSTKCNGSHALNTSITSMLLEISSQYVTPWVNFQYSHHVTTSNRNPHIYYTAKGVCWALLKLFLPWVRNVWYLACRWVLLSAICVVSVQQRASSRHSAQPVLFSIIVIICDWKINLQDSSEMIHKINRLKIKNQRSYVMMFNCVHHLILSALRESSAHD